MARKKENIFLSLKERTVAELLRKSKASQASPRTFEGSIYLPAVAMRVIDASCHAVVC